MHFAKNALRAASTSRMAIKLVARSRPSAQMLRRYATTPHSPSPTAENGEDIEIPDRVHPDAPDLMQADVLMDLAETRTFEPSRRTKFRNTVTVRNDDQNMFEVLRQQAGVEANEEMASGGSLFNIPFAYQYRDGQLYVATIFNRYVVQQTSKGRVHRIQSLIVIGNMRGMVGVGLGKHESLGVAASLATKAALRSMDYVERFEDRTVWTDMEHKFGSTQIIMRPRPVGFGLRCNPNLYHILKAAGIKDISAKVWGSRTPLQVVNCALEMLFPGREPLGMGDGIGGPGKRTDKLMGMRTKDEIEQMRGRKMVPLRYP